VALDPDFGKVDRERAHRRCDDEHLQIRRQPVGTGRHRIVGSGWLTTSIPGARRQSS
jgi:hypothetical protein